MKKGLVVIIASLFMLSFTFGLAIAGENAVGGEAAASGIGPDYAGYSTHTLVFNSAKRHNGAYALKVDWNKTLQYLYVRVKDSGIKGDSWVAAFGRRSGAQVIQTSNRNVITGVPYDNFNWSPWVRARCKNSTIYVVPGIVPKGFAAAMQVELYLPVTYTVKIKKYQ